VPQCSHEILFHPVVALALAISPGQEGRTQSVDAHRTSSQPHQEAFDVAREGTAGEWLAIGIQKQVTSWAHLRPEFLHALLEETAELTARLEIYLFVARETSGLIQLDVDGDLAGTFHEDNVAMAELPGREGVVEFPLLHDLEDPDFQAP